MRETVPARAGTAIFACDKSGKKNDTDVVDDEKWFARIVENILPHKPGTALDCITDLNFGERNCQRWAAGQVQPASLFIRALLRSDEGWVFFAAFMDGSDAPWWRDLQQDRRIASQIRSLDLT